MTPKKAITIVLILFFIMAIIFVFLYIKKQSEAPAINLQEPAQNKAVENVNTNQQPSKEVESQIQQEIKKKTDQIQIEAKNRSLNQDEINMILSPKKTIEQELGQATSSPTSNPTLGNPPSQEDINSILIPKKK
mgnify:CR=1 FL=1